jgi:two-component system sensor histidine kinase KdpD
LLDRRGRERWLSVHTAAVAGVGGRAERLLMQVIDITEARELREQLQQSVEGLSLAYREKAALMTALSHDLRTPLAAIRILAELLVTSDGPAHEGERAEFARRLLAEAARTEGVLGDLVASERASSGPITPRRSPIALNDLVQRVVDLEGDDHVSSHVIIVRPAVGDCTVSADPALIERMVANLISNALRHTPSGTTVWVSVEDDSSDGNGAVRLVVEDDGDGVPDTLKEAIFEPYVRGAASDRPGTGIGLFLVRRFAEFHGGSVVCGNRDGGGASFRVTLPRL